MDVISILQKKRQNVTSFEVNIKADQSTEHPRVFTHLLIEYILEGKEISREAVKRAVQLSAERYCPAQAMLKPSVPMDLKITFLEE